jgi:hypothetical protein
VIVSKKSLSLWVLLALFGGVIAAWLYLKTEAAALAKLYSTTWNEPETCYINSYIPQYSKLGTPGAIAKIFTSEAFFRVYSKDGKLLRSSEWLLWKNEFTTDEQSRWVGGRAIYPTVSGYDGWIIPECR